MPKKKATIVDNETEINNIVNEQIDKELGVKEEEVKPIEEVVVEEETPKEEIKAEEKIADFDPEKFAEQTAIKVKELQDAEEKKRMDEFNKSESEAKEKDEMIPNYVREGRNPKDYAEINDEAQRIAELKFNKILEQRETQAKQKEEETLKAKEETLAKSKQFEADFNKMIDEELTEMYASNKIPKIVDDKDPNDPGVKTRFNLFKTMQEVNTKRVAAGEQPITSISRIFNNYYKAPTGEVAGADAPISAGSGIIHDEGKDDVMPYDKMHKTSFLDFFKKK
jgi:hypothetical protein